MTCQLCNKRMATRLIEIEKYSVIEHKRVMIKKDACDDCFKIAVAFLNGKEVEK